MGRARRAEVAPESSRYSLEVSGVARGNPGLAGAGAVIKDERGRTVERLSCFLGVATPLQAEYQALRVGLEAVERRKPGRLDILTANEPLQRQVIGRSSALIPEIAGVYTKVRDLVGRIQEVEVRCVEPEAVAVAQRLADVAVDTRGRRRAID